MSRGCLLSALWAATALVLGGCAAPPPAPPASRLETAAPAEWVPGAPGGARHFTVVPAQSLLQILVHREGLLSFAGHNHVISSHDFAGTAELAEDASQASVELRIPVRTLDVDDPALRARQGPDFSAVVDDDAREGTRGNLLSPQVLGAARFPLIVITSGWFPINVPAAVAHVSMLVRNRAYSVDVPLTILHRDGQIRAEGRLQLKQTDFGIVPFSMLGGALRVQDALDIEFSVTAAPLPSARVQ